MDARGAIATAVAGIAVLRAVLRPLRRDALLEAASQRHSKDMARRHFFAGCMPCECFVGENLYWGAGVHARR